MPAVEERTRRVSARQAQSLQSQRERLLCAAVDVIAEYGYTTVFAGLVVGRSGISRLTFYQLFHGGEDCFLAVLDDTISKLTAEVTPAYLSGKSWRDQIRAGLSALLSFLDREPDLCSLVVVDALTVGPSVLERRTELLDSLIGVVDKGPKEGSVRDGVKRARKVKEARQVKATARRSTNEPPPLTAEGVVGAVFGVIHARVLEPDHPPLIELLNPLTAMIVLPYLGHAAATKELARATPKPRRTVLRPLRNAPTLRLNQRAHLILRAISASPGLSNKQIADRVGLRDSGHISRVLLYLKDQGLITNDQGINPSGAKAWRVTEEGERIERGVEVPAAL
jgi:AcrR family transcriptional regulator